MVMIMNRASALFRVLTPVQLLLWFVWFVGFASAQELVSGPIVIPETKHDVSAAARHLALWVPRVGRSLVLDEDSDEIIRSSNTSNATSGRGDVVVQRSAGTRLSTSALLTVGTRLSASTFLNFDGLPSNGYGVSDSNGSIGATQFVEVTNDQYGVYDKVTGALLLGPAALTTLWAGFGGLCETGGTPFDPIVLYDKAAGRWLISEFVEDSALTSFIECIAVSTTSDATGSYARYGFSSGTTLEDYPKFGVWPDAYYSSANSHANGVTFTGSQVCAYDRTAMLAGQTAQAVCFQKNGTSYLLPSDLDGTTPPPVGSPNYFVKLASPLPSNSLSLYQFHVDFTNPLKSRFSSPPLAIPINSWVRLCPTTIVCIPEPFPGEKVNSISNHLMYRLAYRNFGDHEALVVTHTVDAGGAVAGIRWYEIRSPRSAPFVFQQGTYSSTSAHLWMGTMAMDKNGDIALGMNASNTTLFPSILISGRSPTDPVGTLQDFQTVVSGTGVQKNDSHRWGDYSSISVDPVDDCTFWYTAQYYKTTGIATWNTHVVTFKFPNCN